MRSPRSAFVLVAALIALPVQAQTVGEVRGKVIDQDGRAVENAEVELRPGSRRAITLDDGRFVITNVRHGVYVLSARRVGYEPIDVTVAVGDTTVPRTITLVAIAVQLDAIHIREKSLGIQYSAVVLDQNDLPVAGAEVAAMGITGQLKTDDLGRFTVPKLARGTLMLRIRKIGYAAYFDSFRILAERADTIRMSRLAESLTPVEVRERSGFGADEWTYRDLDQRTRWKGSSAGAISREELAQQGSVNLCDAIPRTAGGGRYVPITPYDCQRKFYRVLLDGVQCQMRPLTDFTADEVEAIEYFPRPRNVKITLMNSDLSGNLAARGCPPEVFVIWTRHDAPQPTPTRVAADAPNPAVDTAGPQVRLPPVEIQAAVPLLNPSQLQGQVVDSANHPIRSTLVYTEDPLFATLTDKNGYFRIRELPSGPITVRAEHSGFVPIEFQLRLPPDSTVGIGLKLLRAATTLGTLQIDSGSGAGTQGRTVRVVSEQGQPIMYANVTLEGATTRITDEKGEINLGIGARQTYSVRVSRIGFAPWFGKVDLPAVATMTVTLPQVARMLAPVTVTGEAQLKTPLQATGFYDRWMMRQQGTISAVFIGPEELEFRHPNKITNLLSGLNGVQVHAITTKGAGMSDNLIAFSTTSAHAMELCPMAVLIDGHQERPPVYIDRVLDANAVMAIEVYERGGNMPIGLQADDTACGVIAFWTGSRR